MTTLAAEAAAALVAKALGGDVGRWRGGIQARVPGISHSASDRSVAINFGVQYPGGFRVVCFGRGDYRAERERVLALLAGLAIAASAGASSSRERKPNPNALWLWQEARDPQGTRVEAYLRHRGLRLPEFAGESLRYDPHHPFDGERVPAMLALVRDIRSNQPMALHRSAISWGSTNYNVHGKDRMALGPIAGSCVKLTPDENVENVVAIGEGIESSLSLQLTEYGRSPVWACLNSAGVASFPVLPGVEVLWIGVDNDPPGIDAAETCCCRWQRAGREVILIRPYFAQADLNDLVRGRHHA